MSRICVITSDGAVYYAIVSRLRSAGLPFLSVLPGGAERGCGLVITTRSEALSFKSPTFALEDMDEDPDVARGQILARLSEGGKTLLVGVDPGSRIGAAAFLGEARLASRTFNSKSGACSWVADLVERVPSRRSVVRIGDGDLGMANWIAGVLEAKLPDVAVEIVDESGTSRRPSVKGLPKDQGSAAKIAFRKGLPFRRETRASKSRSR
ncbi:MAG: hypothetical protein LYZ66_05545 [Nitrososphaerales archaeon]|nr:hypothetical protein [Nitrososphaerales archaeon]